VLAVALAMGVGMPALAQGQVAEDQIRIAYAPKAFHFTNDDEYVK
jgi:hypothetical protein